MAPAYLLKLPLELRARIYEEIFIPNVSCETVYDYRKNGGDHAYLKLYRYDLALLRANRQIHDEACRVFHAKNTFVRIPDILSTGSLNGFPRVLAGQDAESFTAHSMEVEIASKAKDPPYLPPLWDRDPSETPTSLIIRAEDLPLAIASLVEVDLPRNHGVIDTRAWDYSVTLDMRQPVRHAPALSLAKQRLLLLPFADVTSSPLWSGGDRRLGEVPIIVTGDVKVHPEVLGQLVHLRGKGVDPAARLAKAELLVAHGDQLFETEDPAAALENYELAMTEMNVLTRDDNLVSHCIRPRSPDQMAVNYQSEVKRTSYKGRIIRLYYGRDIDYYTWLDKRVQTEEPDHDGLERVYSELNHGTSVLAWLQHKEKGTFPNEDGKWEFGTLERQRLCQVITARMVRTLHRLGRTDDAIAWGEGVVGYIRQYFRHMNVPRSNLRGSASRNGQTVWWYKHYCALPTEEANLFHDAPGASAIGEIYYHLGMIRMGQGYFALAKSLIDVVAVYNPIYEVLTKAAECHSRMNLRIISADAIRCPETQAYESPEKYYKA